MKNIMDKRVRHSGVWQPNQFDFVANAISSGSPLLDSQLGGNGWGFERVYQVAEQQSQRLFALMLPAVYRMMDQKRWIILISPPKSVVHQFRNLPNFDANRLLVVHTKDDFDASWAMEGAIRNRNAACIFSWISQSDERDIKRLKLAARQSNSLNVLIHAGADTDLKVYGYDSGVVSLDFDAMNHAGNSGFSPRFH